MQQKQILQHLLRTLKKNCPSEDLTDVKRAYEFVRTAYGDMRRASGNKQIEHSVNVATLLAEWKLSPDIIIAGLLHDILEYSNYSEDDIRQKFGQKIARLIVGENRLDSLKYWGKERYAENLRRMFMAMAEDVQIIFIKFADRIDNLKTLSYLPPRKQERLAMESMQIYAAIANRLGMNKIKRELEDLSFSYLKPKEYEEIFEVVSNYYHDDGKSMKIIESVLHEGAKTAGIKILNIDNRIKSLYSLYEKFKFRNRDVKNVYDIAACRIIVPTISDCYAMLGLIHRYWKPLPGRFKDYISQPKPNGYRSLHTNVFCERKVVEFQVRTPEMHEEAEFGIAAHWIYKEKEKNITENIRRHTVWLKELSEIQMELKNNFSVPQTIRSVKIDLFHNRIFAVTPKGDVVDLPEDATPIDFAYSIHAQLGNYFQKAKVNGKIVPITHKIKSNDVVEIFKNDKPTAKKSWLKIAVTRRARNEIRDFLKMKH